jgi:hypothetical protein
MAQYAELDIRIRGLCEEAKAMLLANLLDIRKAFVLRKRLRECEGHARDAGHSDGESQLRRTAEELAARFPAANE